MVPAVSLAANSILRPDFHGPKELRGAVLEISICFNVRVESIGGKRSVLSTC